MPGKHDVNVGPMLMLMLSHCALFRNDTNPIIFLLVNCNICAHTDHFLIDYFRTSVIWPAIHPRSWCRSVQDARLV